MAIEVKMPQLGESVTEGTIGKWLKEPGDEVEKYEPLLEVISDKVDTEVTATQSGTLLSIEVPEGETVPVGTVLAYLGEAGEEAPSGDGRPAAEEEAVAEAPETDAERKPAAATEAAPSEEMPPKQRISPVVARLTAEHDVDLSKIDGTGRGGRITKKDVLAYVEEREKREEEAVPEEVPERAAAPEPVTMPETAPAAAPQPPKPTGEDELVELSHMRRSIAEHMVRSKQTAPHVTSVFEVDLSNVVAHRERNKQAYADQGLRLTYTAYFIEAAVDALQQHPMVNSSFTEDGVLLRADINVGVAVATEGGQGLIVPVIDNADELSLKGIVRALNDLTDRARNRQLDPDDVQGGTFTITNYGIAGSLLGTPIINQPQTAIMGLGKIEKRVVVVETEAGDSIAIRPMCYLTLTFDHRVLDGASGDAFMRDVVEFLETYPVD